MWQVREALADDMAAIERLVAQVSGDHYRLEPGQFVAAESESAGILGCGRLRPYPGFCEVASLAVDEHRRTKGVGRAIVARLLELASVIPAMQTWAKAIDPSAPFRHETKLPDSARGIGLVEAARGSLGHWIEIKKGKISQYQIVAPTSWNFSPRDSFGIPGALEQALEGAPVRPGETEPVAVQHIVRSFDPCMACTVH